VWGIDGWQPLPDDVRPPNTEIVSGLMRTRMVHDADDLVTTLRVPAGARCNFGFLITERRDGEVIKPVWSEVKRPAASTDSFIWVKSRLKMDDEGAAVVQSNQRPLVTEEIQYRLPSAVEVFLVWGVDGWYAMPRSRRPSGTKILYGHMATPMSHDGYSFVVRLSVPLGTSIDYGFLITRIRWPLDLVEPIFDGDYHMNAKRGGMIKLASNISPLGDLLELIPKPATCLHVMALFLGIWALLFLLFGVLRSGGLRYPVPAEAGEIADARCYRSWPTPAPRGQTDECAAD